MSATGVSELFALFLAGLSLFFTGVSGLSSKLQQLGSRRVRQLLGRLTNHPVLAALAGVGFGALTQSGSAVAFIAAGAVATGLLALRRALPIVAAANIGTAALVFLAAFDFRLAVLYVVGVTGLMICFKISARHEALLGALFAAGLLFFGLDLMKRAVAPLPGMEGFRDAVAFLREWSVAPFLLGAACRLVIQSSSAIGVIAVALEHGGLLSPHQAVLLIFGAGPGVALSAYFLSSTLQGPPRQVLLYQGIINLIAGCVLAGVVALQGATGFSLPPAVLDLAGGADLLAWAFLASMVGACLAGLVLLPVAEPLLNALSPRSVEQDLSRAVYLHDEAVTVPDTALDLADKEQLRLFSIVLQVLDSVREEAAGAPADHAALARAGAELGSTIDGFLAELIDRGVSADAALRLLALERRQDHLDALLETTRDLAAASTARRLSPPRAAVLGRLQEALSLIFLTARDAWSSHDAEDVDLLQRLSADRGDLMERLRRRISEGQADSAESATLLYLTSLFERAVWLVRQIGFTLA